MNKQTIENPVSLDQLGGRTEKQGSKVTGFSLSPENRGSVTPPENLDNSILTQDPEQTQRFLSALGDRHWFQTFDDSPEKNRRLARQAIGVSPSTSLLELNADTTAGLFVAVNTFNGKRNKDNIKTVRALFVDMDGKDADADKLSELPPYSIRVESSPGNFHYYWLLNEGESVSDWQSAIVSLIRFLCADKACKNSDRVMRLPGSLHHKRKDGSSSHRVELLECHPERRYSIADIASCIPQPTFTAPLRITEEPVKVIQQTYSTPPDCQNFSRRIRDVRSEDKLSTILSMIGQAKEPGRNNFLNLAAYAAREHTRSYLDADILASLLLTPALECGLSLEESRKTIQSAIEAVDRTYGGLKGKPKLFAELRGHYGDSLQYDTRSFSIVRDGHPIEALESLCVQYVDSTARDISFDNFSKTLTALTRKDYSFDPVIKYLNRLSRISVADAEKFFNEQSEVMGLEPNSHEEMLLKRYAVGAVKRAYEPGCLMDWCLVLKGNGGSGKSSFFGNRAPYPGAVSIIESIKELKSDNYGYKALRSNWITVLDELDTVFGRHQELSEAKPLITKTADKFRVPYGKEEETHYRAGVFGATVNGDTPLKDDGAELRRWCVINIPGGREEGRRRAIYYKETCDLFWQSALALYHSGYGCTLTPSEDSVERGRKAESTSRVSGSLILLDQIEDIERHLYGTANAPKADAPAFPPDILNDFFLGSGTRTRAAEKDIKQALKDSGWTNKQFRYNKHRQYLYRPEWYDTQLIGRLGKSEDLEVSDYGY